MIYTLVPCKVMNMYCICLPEMKKDTIYKIKLSMNKRQIKTATYVVFLLVFALQEGANIFLHYAMHLRMKKLHSPWSCTSVLQKWNQPRKQKLEETTSFVKHEYGKEKKVAQYLVYDPHPPSLRSTSESSVETLRHDLVNTKKDIVLIHLLPNTSSVNITLSSSHLPPYPLAVQEQIISHLQSQPQPLNFTDVCNAGLTFVETLSVHSVWVFPLPVKPS